MHRGAHSWLHRKHSYACQKLVEQFAELTNTDEALAQFYLQDRDWNLERSVNAFFEAKKEEDEMKALQVDEESEIMVTFNSKLVSVMEKGVLTEEAPKNFCFLTWNIDGLDEKNLKKRTKAVAKIIEREKADIVFLQEVIANTLTYLEQLLPQFLFLAGDTEDYFIVTLLRRTTVYFDGQTVVPFANTCMGRNLLCVENKLFLAQAHIGDLKLHLLNSHLESTGEFAKQRVEQLRTGFTKMKDGPAGVTTLFGGDLNLRDKEVVAAGMPQGVVDLWEACGQRPECKWTWDTARNSNKEFPGRFKPRLRFDRVYQHTPSSSTLSAVPLHFGLVGLQKVINTQSFPSDHWGIIVHFEMVLRVGSWNVLSLSDDRRLPLLSGELSRLRVDIVGLSEMRRPGSGETSSGGYTYYWSGMSNGHREPYTKLKDLTCAHEYAVVVSNRINVLGALEDNVELWDTFKRETLQTAKECIGERPRSRRGFVATETLENIEESRTARHARNQDQYGSLSRRTRTLLRKDKERYVRNLAEDVEGHLNANALRPAYRALKKLRSKSPSRASAIRAADERLVSDMEGNGSIHGECILLSAPHSLSGWTSQSSCRPPAARTLSSLTGTASVAMPLASRLFCPQPSAAALGCLSDGLKLARGPPLLEAQ
ncbi:Tyrosyl-DNA phosphodiesterase 2 [Chionoecetes opilio]|uniref:Tyrosyl-DNA phosphodiesterase 2 n=1 Tax=Chionoecetes opilio TaxID=41210 RepID=A0A8J4XUG2_CHIOP|nr:Tyrosyl-DNA phosphodiesterase 2 [Chionoecetes opilio]